jgi:TldD protein
MRDGAASTLSAASYFFDDDGVLAGDTQIIKDGILITGISDLASATQLGLAPTGNGRRESTRRKAYARMTNTFFEKGTDKLEDMIASIKHGYMLFETNNGMEDPKNWAIQCVAEYGIEIVDGKLTDNYVSPVVMSGYVPDLLKSISMISDEFKIIGSGGCGKGYKEWVRVSDGGPALKAKVKLG